MEAAPPPVLVVSSQHLSVYRSVQWALILIGVLVYLLFLTVLCYSRSSDVNGSEDVDGLSMGEHCLYTVCVSKCCPDHQGFSSADSLICSVDNSSERQEFIYDLTSQIKTRGQHRDELLENENASASVPVILIDQCNNNIVYNIGYNKSFLVGGGSLLTRDHLYVDGKTSCFEFVIGSGDVVVKGCASNLTLHSGYRSAFANVIEVATPICIILSTLSLISVLIVYSCLSQLRNLQGKIVICYVISVILFHTTFLLSEFIPTYDMLEAGWTPSLDQGCRLTLLCWLTWLTVMCYDIWSTFSRPLRPRSPGTHVHGLTFLLYSFVGWGFPTSISIIHVFIIDNNIGSTSLRYFIFFEVYLNLVMFVSTLANMRLHKIARTDSLNSESSQRHSDSNKDGVLLYGKLSFLMGFDWFVFFLALAIGNSDLTSVAFLVVESQGMFVFIFFVYNKRVLRLLRDKCRRRRDY